MWEAGNGVGSFHWLWSALFLLDLRKPLVNTLLQPLVNARNYIISEGLFHSERKVDDYYQLELQGKMRRDEESIMRQKQRISHPGQGHR